MSRRGSQRIVIERATESDGAEVFVIGDETGEFARAGTPELALPYVSDLLYGPGVALKTIDFREWLGARSLSGATSSERNQSKEKE